MTMHPIPIPRAYYFTFSLYLSDRCVFGSASASHTMHTLAQPAALSLRVLGLQANMRILHCQLNLRQGREQAYRSLKVLVQLSCAMPSSVLQLCASLRLLSSLAAIAEGMMAPYQWKRLSIWCMQLMLPKLKRSPSTLTLHHALEFVGLHALYVTSIKRSLLFIACPLHSSWIHTSLVVGRNIYSLLADDVQSVYSLYKDRREIVIDVAGSFCNYLSQFAQSYIPSESQVRVLFPKPRMLRISILVVCIGD